MQRPDRLHLRLGLALVALAALLIVVLAWRLISPAAGLVTAGVAAFAVLLGATILVLPPRLVARDSNIADLDAEKRASAINSVRSTLVQGLIGLAALAGILVAWQQLQTDREQSRIDREQLREQLTLTRQGQVAERFTHAVDQLGGEKLEQRLGGIYGMERIAEESSSTRLQVFEVLTAYVREHARPDAKAGRSAVVTPLRVRSPDVQAALTVLGRRTVIATDPRLDLSATDLRGADLREAKLQRANLHGTQLQGANLEQAQLQGASLYQAQLQGAFLSGAEFKKAQLIGANLQLAQLIVAQLQGANLYQAQLQGANLEQAQLQEADLRGTQLQRAILRGTQLQGAEGSSATDWPDGFDWKAAGVRRMS